MNTAIYAVGDIHGRLDELERIVASIVADGATHGILRPRTVFLGDYIDRGPDSRGVLDTLSGDELRRQLDPVFLRGNHDQMPMAALRGNVAARDMETWLAVGGLEFLASYGVDPLRDGGAFLHRLQAAMPTAHKEFLDNLLPAHNEGRWFFSHAGIDPTRPLSAQPLSSLIHGTKAFLDHTGDYGLVVVHGHWTNESVLVRPNRIGVDTRCGFPGGRLSAVALEPNGMVRVIED